MSHQNFFFQKISKEETLGEFDKKSLEGAFCFLLWCDIKGENSFEYFMSILYFELFLLKSKKLF